MDAFLDPERGETTQACAKEEDSSTTIVPILTTPVWTRRIQETEPSNDTSIESNQIYLRRIKST